MNGKRILSAALCFSLPFAFYSITLCPTLPAGDSGELITVAYTLGVAHPPGYPLYTLLGKLFTFLPMGSVAFQMNLLSALLNATALALLSLAVFQCTRSFWASLLASLALAFSPIFWLYSLVAEVFALNNFFSALFLLMMACLWKGSAQKEMKIFLLLPLVMGLAAAHHHTILFFFPGIALLYLLALARRRISLRLLPFCGGLFLLGLLPYLYLPLAASLSPPLNWDDPVTFERFFHLLVRKDYGTFSLAARGIQTREIPFFAHSLLYLGSVPGQFLYGGALFALLGMGGNLFARKRRVPPPGKAREKERGKSPFPKPPPIPAPVHWVPLPIFIASALPLAFTILFFFPQAGFPPENLLLRGVIERFYMLPNLILAFWMGIGIHFAGTFLKERKRKTGAVLLYGTALFLFGPLALGLRYREVDQSQNRTAYDFGKNILRSVPEKALLFTSGDMPTNTVNYLQLVEGFRASVICLDQELLTYPWYVRSVKNRFPSVKLRGEKYDNIALRNIHFIEDNQATYPVYFFGFKKGDESFKERYSYVPAGLVFKIVPKGAAIDPEEVERENQRILASFERLSMAAKPSPKTFEREMKERYAVPYFELGLLFYQKGIYARSVHFYKQSLRENPDYASTHKNLALALQKCLRYGESIGYFRKYLRKNPDAPDRRQILQAVESMEEYERRKKGSE